MEFKFSYAKQKQNREQFQQMAAIIEQYRAGYDEAGLPLYTQRSTTGEGGPVENNPLVPFEWGVELRNDPRPPEQLPLQARLQVERNTQDTYESSWQERKAQMEQPPPPPPYMEDEDLFQLVLLELHTHFLYPELLQ